MSVRIRLTRAGRRHLPFYHIGVYDIQQRRDGAAIDRIGIYDPICKDASQQFRVDTAKAAEWLAKGAKPSETAAALLKKCGVEIPAWAKERKKRERVKKAKDDSRAVQKRTKKRTSNSKDRKAKKKEA